MKREESLTTLTEQLNLGVLEVDNMDTILQVNDSFLRLTGYAKEDLLGKTAHEILCEPHYKTQINEILEDRKKGLSSNYQARIRCKNGATKTFIVSGTPLFGDNNKIVGSIGFHMDITETKDTITKLELEKSKTHWLKKQQDILFAAISHEFKTPLQTIISFLENIDIDDLQDPIKQNLSVIYESAQHLKQFAHDLSIYNSLNIREIPLHPTSFNLKSVINQIIQAKNHAYKRMDLQWEIITSNQGECFMIYSDKARLTQMLANIIDNYHLHHKFNSKISIHLSCTPLDRDNHNIKIEFKPDLISTVPGSNFAQANSSRGLGLGQAITKKLARRLGGEARFEPTETNTVNVIITFNSEPMAKTLLPIETELEQKLNSLPDLSTFRVLIAEDNEVNAAILYDLCTSLHAKTEVVNNLDDFLLKITNFDYDLYITDVIVGSGNGLFLLSCLQVICGDYTPCIISSALSEKIVSQAGLKKVLLPKPFTKNDYISSIEEALREISVPESYLKNNINYNLIVLCSCNYDQLFKLVNRMWEQIKGSILHLREEIRSTNSSTMLNRVLHELKGTLSFFHDNEKYIEIIRDIELDVSAESPGTSCRMAELLHSLEEIQYSLHKMVDEYTT